MKKVENQDKDLLKLSKLCQHWADHNNSHKESFSKWRDTAKDKGLDEVVTNLNKAIKMIDKCSEYLLAAKQNL
ncbi:hypothetical protein LCGC14_1006090 [marine sediment metagenome]|uniref:DUF8180 domain-containing protein n=1 Tax=marine sediment metagenome TaxID=412755 RepID=A0A0F9N1R6_9ZZZZ